MCFKRTPLNGRAIRVLCLLEFYFSREWDYGSTAVTNFEDLGRVIGDNFENRGRWKGTNGGGERNEEMEMFLTDGLLELKIYYIF